MLKTEFAGLTELEPGESLATDGYSFQSYNPVVIDRLLKLGARTHRHDAHPGLNNPADAPVLVLTANGSLPPNADIAIAYTLVDVDGGETKPSPTSLVTTSPPLDAPEDQPNADTDALGGHITAGTYTYAMTLTDPNGETTAGPPFLVNVDAGTDTNVITLSGLADIVASTPGATGWRIYKTSSVGQLHFLAAGGAALDDVVDDGLLCADCNVTPPTANSTSVSQGLQVTVPATVTNAQTGIVGYRVYASVGGVFSSPAYVEQRNDFGAVIDYTHIVVDVGQPPDVSTSYGGAQQIDPDTELLDWHWKRPVATAADLTEPADPGDARVVTADGTIWVFTDTWHEFQAPALNWKPAVANLAALPPLGDPGNAVGDVRLAIDTRVLWLFLADGWINITAPPHEIRSDVATMPQRLGLQFINCDVADDVANNQTVITALGGGGGGGGAPGTLNMGDAVAWVDGAGATQISLHAERENIDTAWFNDGFNDPLLDYVNQDHNVDTSGPGFLVPLPDHPLNADVRVRKGGPGGDVRLDQEADAEQFHVHLLNFNVLGLGIAAGAVADSGIYMNLIQTAGVFTVDVITRANNAAAWVTAAHHDVDPATLVADDDLTFTIRRENGSLTYGIWNETQGVPVLDYTNIPVPATVAAFQGTPAIWSNLTDLAAWNLNTLRAVIPTPVYRLYATAGGDTISIIDTTGDRDWSQRGTVSMDWAWGGAMRLTPDGMGIELSGVITKQGGANPMADEVMFTISGEGNFSWSNNASFPVVTGDQDGEELGFVKFDSNLGAFVWQEGRSSDPATKFPYVRLDGIVIPR